ncbi:Hypothetical protein CpCP13_2094 [Corynebacterium pseudotuberculosis]|nr:Hypothetical protein CpPAT10_2055b [Corynebacterium pseudotuberculosis PAT10]AEP71269.1 Hypothetical protein Cp4202_2042 [Corynebacterium pseudotuberculosis 42/02-A]AFF23193.1 Hypothetical protein CpP54B96_2084 [Corynebacterium pseudotuberculosis P54B96]AFH52997.1 Hypothetical protein Cp267_2127 [Corynebacterium pseudotuberculosis 267]AJC14781.1 hypothetical protein CpVD57_2090 [Corynebacterium pseudotuberculosis]
MADQRRPSLLAESSPNPTAHLSSVQAKDVLEQP